MFFSGSALTLGSSRMVYAFARDGATPFSKYLSKVNKVTKTPVWAVWANVTFAAIVGILVRRNQLHDHFNITYLFLFYSTLSTILLTVLLCLSTPSRPQQLILSPSSFDSLHPKRNSNVVPSTWVRSPMWWVGVVVAGFSSLLFCLSALRNIL
jgi:amino acid transporter